MAGGALVRACWSSARQAFPRIDLPEERFAEHLSERVSAGTPLESLRTDDLYVACACLAGLPSALAELEATYLASVRQALARMQLGPLLDDAMQVLRERLLMSDGVRAPRLRDYAGRGALKGWLRVMAVRIVLDELGRKRPELLVDDPAKIGDEQLRAGLRPDLGPIADDQRQAFKLAFERAFITLSVRQQNLLRQQIVDGLTIDDLGALYHVHRATAARWLKEVRTTLVFRTREEMQATGLSHSACDQILERAESQLELSLSRLFAGRAQQA
jgi:RNA polymerase sigma-70 factor (ECF subfamily)